MKAYHTPKIDLQITDSHDIVCGSNGISIGNGGNDIVNWEWTLPSATVINVADVSKK